MGLPVVLHNALKTAQLENHKNPLVTFQAWCGIGARNVTSGLRELPYFAAERPMVVFSLQS